MCISSIGQQNIERKVVNTGEQDFQNNFKKQEGNMKKIFAVTTILVLLVATAAFTAEMNSHRNRQHHTKPICSKVLDSPQETFAGVVADIGGKNCVVLEVEGEQVKIYGLGPNWYWEANEIEKPGVGDLVTVTAYAVVFLDATRYVASSVTIAENTAEEQMIQLRDPETGCPLWLSYLRP
jgi:hypothetical protein